MNPLRQMNPLHSEYCNCECPAGNSYAKLEETLNRVRMVHVSKTRDGVTYCPTCVDPNDEYEYQTYPCETMRALAGEE